MLRCRLLASRLYGHIRSVGSRSQIKYVPTTGIRTYAISASNRVDAAIPGSLPSLSHHAFLHHSCVGTVASGRFFCSLTDSEVRKRVEEITDLFFEARELLDDARSSTGTVYFNEDMQDAKVAVQEALSHYEDLLNTLSRGQRDSVMAAIGLKMEELKAQLMAITEEMDD